MLSLLTDSHLSPKVAEQVRARRPESRICSLRFWRGGALLHAEDHEILATALEEGLTLVTYDQRTIVPLVTRWTEEGRDHSGVVLIDDLSIVQEDIGGQVLALVNLWDVSRDEDWANVVSYLKHRRAP